MAFSPGRPAFFQYISRFIHLKDVIKFDSEIIEIKQHL